jgi:NADH dehydrogenase FAD-containing subunit
VRLENDEGEIEYDSLIVAAGGTRSYFGNEAIQMAL